MTLRLTVLLGPRATVEAAERLLPAMPHTLCIACSLPGWDGREIATALEGAREAFIASIQAGAHLSDPDPVPPYDLVDEADEAEEPPLVTPAPPEPVVHHPAADDPLHPSAILLRKVMRELVGADDFAAWLRVEDARATAHRIVALVERRAA